MKNICFALMLGLISPSVLALDALDCSLSLMNKGNSTKIAPDLLHIAADSILESQTTKEALLVSFNVERIKTVSASIVIDGLGKRVLMTAGIRVYLDDSGDLTFSIKGDFNGRLTRAVIDGNNVETITYKNDFATLKMNCSLF